MEDKRRGLPMAYAARRMGLEPAPRDSVTEDGVAVHSN